MTIQVLEAEAGVPPTPGDKWLTGAAEDGAAAVPATAPTRHRPTGAAVLHRPNRLHRALPVEHPARCAPRTPQPGRPARAAGGVSSEAVVHTTPSDEDTCRVWRGGDRQ